MHDQTNEERAKAVRDLVSQIRDEALKKIIFDAPSHEWWGLDMFPEDPIHIKYKTVGMDPGGISESVHDLAEIDKALHEMVMTTVTSFENFCTSQAVSDEQGKPMTYESLMEAVAKLPKHKTYIFVTHKDDWDDLMQTFNLGGYMVVPNIPNDIDPKYEDVLIANTSRFKAILWNDAFGIGLETDFWELEGGIPGKILAIDEQAIRPPFGWRR
jgi:hypothetical protein